MTARALPPRPDLEQYRKQAKDLLKGHARGGHDVLLRIQQHHPRLAGLTLADVAAFSLKLSDAQLVIAREHGFASWPRFQAHVGETTDSRDVDTFEQTITVAGVDLSVIVQG